jgi:hypothetical protein
MPKKKSSIARRRFDMDADIISRFEASVKNLEAIKEDFKEMARGARLAIAHEIVLNGPQGNDGVVCDVAQLKDTVNGNEQKKIIGLGAQIRAAIQMITTDRIIGFAIASGLGTVVGVLTYIHMVEVGTQLLK